MKREYEKYKGIHPGAVLERELDKRNLAQRPFAQSLFEHPQTINAIIKGKRALNTALALKIESALGLEEGSLLVLQMYYDIKKEKQKGLQPIHPEISRLRKSLFWDTNINTINWESQFKAVVKRVFERGNISEKKEIIRFYGVDRIRPVIREAVGKTYIKAKRL